MAKRINKLLALLLVAVLMVGLLPTTVFATSDQVVSNGQEITTEDGSVKHSKLIEQVGENTFDITLKIQTKEEIQQQTISPDAAVVLVMDVSNSMKETVDGKEPKKEEEQRIYKAKEAAENFIDNFVSESNDAVRKVALVEFGSSAYTVQDWTDPATAKTAVSNVKIGYSYPACSINGSHTHEENTIEWGGFLGLQWRCTEKDCQYYKKESVTNWGWYTLFNRNYEGHTHTKSYSGPHGQIRTDGGGTNIEGGLMLANNLLNSSTVDGIGNCYVVLITDGVPTYHAKDHNDSSINFIEGAKGGGNYATVEDYTYVPNVAATIKEKAPLYTVSYASGQVSDKVGGKSIDQWLTSFATQNIVAGTDIFAGLEDVTTIIQNQAKAWILEDPMGTFIGLDLDDSTNHGIANAAENPNAVLQYDATTRMLTWDLKSAVGTSSETVNGVTWYTYKTTYRVTLNTNEKDFVSDVGYPTNGKTTLSYMITKDGVLQPDLKSTELLVPVVTGKIPNVTYTINYLYKDRTNDTYTIGKTYSEVANLWDSVTIDSENFKKDYYGFSHGDSGTQQLTGDQMVFNLYYDPIAVNVLVNHYLVTIEKTDSGESVSEPKLYDTDTYSTEYCEGDTFNNTKYLGNCTKVDSVKVGDTTYTSDKDQNVKLNKQETVINLYYTKEVEKRTEVGYEVHYFYRTDSWQINNDGKYAPVTGTYAEDASKAILNGKGYLNASYTAPDKNGDFMLDKILFNGADNNGNYAVTLGKDKNVIEVYYYETPSSPSADTATLTIEHKYYETTIDGKQEVASDNWKEVDAQTVYVGETWRANPDLKGYTLQTPVEQLAVSIIEAGKSYKIVVEYLRDARIPAEIVENHYYHTYVWTVDSVSGEGDYVEDTDRTYPPDLIGIGPDSVHYVGETYIPRQIPSGYKLNENDSDEEGRVLIGGTNIFDLHYETFLGEKEVADVTVNHIYETYTSYVNADGTVIRLEKQTEPESEDPYYGIPGDTFDAVKREKDGFAFVCADTDDLKVILAGANGQYNMYYEKFVNDLGESVPVTVQTVLKTYTTFINENGLSVRELTETERQLPVSLDEEHYANEKVGVLPSEYAPSIGTGFSHDAEDEENTPGCQITVSAGGDNVITIVYSKEVDSRGLPIVVLVNNVYTTVTKYVADGSVKTDLDTLTSSNTTYHPYYIGQFFDTTDKGTRLPGYSVDVREGITQPEANIKLTGDAMKVTFYWYQEIDRTVPSTVKVIHHYTVHDANPNAADRVWTVGSEENLPGTFFAGESFVASYDFQDGIFSEQNVTEVTPSGAVESAGIMLTSGANIIDIYYVKNIDTRVNTTAKVVHNYFHDAEALVEGRTEASYEEHTTVREADMYKAVLRTENSGIVYGFDSADPVDYSIVVNKDAEKNVININYIRAEASFTVVHSYYTNGSLDGSTSSTVGGRTGDIINAADIDRITSYNGNTYSYTGASAETVTLTTSGDNTITLRYDRTTGGSGGGTSYRNVTVNYLEEGTERILQTAYSQRFERNMRYDVTEQDAIEIAGYVYVKTTGDELSGTLNSDKEIFVWYAAAENIDDPDVPGGDRPDTAEPGDGTTEIGEDPVPGSDRPADLTSIEDGQVPMGDAPATGDVNYLGILLFLALASCIGMGALAVTGKNKKHQQ